MHVMDEEVREELELIPAHVQVTRYVREKYGCSHKSSSTSSSSRCRCAGRKRCSLVLISR
ncbi:IS66 family transposase zinc-finger binding domain-containing protein [Edwardsiella tarda]